jgi:sugar phosphate isomerase/epimerase
MNKFKIGAISDSFRLPVRQSVAMAKELGADGVSLYAVSQEFSPETMSQQARRDFKQYCSSIGIEIASLVGELGGHGWRCPNENLEKIPKLKQIVNLAADLDTKIITSHIGVIPADRGCKSYAVMVAACTELARFAAANGVCFGIETGPEPAAVLRAFLDDLNEPGIGVNLDPANLVMVVRDNPVQAVHILAPYIIATHAKDGRNLQPCNPLEVYNAFAEGGFEQLVARTGQLFEELPLGQGDVPWTAYLNALTECGFNGYLTIERETGDTPAEDIGAAITFLRQQLADRAYRS